MVVNSLVNLNFLYIFYILLINHFIHLQTSEFIKIKLQQ